MRRFKCYKIVEAEVISSWTNNLTYKSVTVVGKPTSAHLRYDVPENFFARGYPQEGDYLVRYEDGYLSWSPKAVFEAGYTELVANATEAAGE